MELVSGFFCSNLFAASRFFASRSPPRRPPVLSAQPPVPDGLVTGGCLQAAHQGPQRLLPRELWQPLMHGSLIDYISISPHLPLCAQRIRSALGCWGAGVLRAPCKLDAIRRQVGSETSGNNLQDSRIVHRKNEGSPLLGQRIDMHTKQ